MRLTKGTNIPQWLSVISRLFLAIIFFLGGLPKLFALDDFAQVISNYGLLPDSLLYPAAIILPLFEMVIALGLLANKRWAVFFALALLSLFIIVLSYGIYLGLDIDCGCFGPEDPEHKAFSGLKTSLIRDIFFFIVAGYAWWHAWLQNNKSVEEKEHVPR